MLKYIPELEQQVEVLIQKKEELISRISTQGEQIHQENQRTIVGRGSLSAVSANWLNDNEVMIQISIYKVHKSPLADILLNLEKDGFLVLNASSFECFGGRIFHNLHLQVCVMLFVNCFLMSKLKVNVHKRFSQNYTFKSFGIFRTILS